MDSDTRVSSWSEVCAHLGAKATLVAGKGDSASLQVPTTAAPWTVELRVVDVYGEPWLEMQSKIGEARFASPQGMMADTSATAIGSLCVAHDGTVLLRQALPLAGLRVLDLDEAVVAVATQAAKAANGLARHAPPQ